MITHAHKGKILAVTLFLSLAANVFLGSHVVGRYFSQDGDCRHSEWRKKDTALREKLSAADRAVLEENRGKHRAQFKQARQAVEVARAEVYAASHAEPFDQAALDAALAAESKAKAAMLSLIREKKASIMRRLSPEGQAVFKAVGEKYGDRLKDRSGDKRP